MMQNSTTAQRSPGASSGGSPGGSPGEPSKRELALHKLTMNELTGRILDMAQTGVYRESLFEAFRPVATKRHIKDAIALAKQFGLHSDPTLRDSELGTYYQVSPGKVIAFQAALNSNSIALSAGDDMAARLQLATRVVRLMLVVSGGGAIALLLLGAGYIITGKPEAAAMWWTSALCTGGIWLWQKNVAKPLL
ncbi:MAG: hypothetical protein AAFP03_17470 [Cyanobacteria bacterium J06598_3]